MSNTLSAGADEEYERGPTIRALHGVSDRADKWVRLRMRCAGRRYLHKLAWMNKCRHEAIKSTTFFGGVPEAGQKRSFLTFLELGSVCCIRLHERLG